MRKVAKNLPVSKDAHRKSPAQWEGESAAIYCRISHVADEDQTGVDRQERLCREVSERLGLVVTPDQIYVDNNRSAWKRNRLRKGWDAMLTAARNGTVKHIVAYHPDRLMRQPKDLEELLTIADDADIMLHGQANRRDLSDPDDRFFLRIEVAHACRSSDDTSRRLKDAMVDQAAEGRPHAGNRRYGYADGGLSLVPAEAEIVREVFRRYLDGDTPTTIARDLNARGIATVTPGKVWHNWTVRNLLDSRYVAAIRVFRKEEIGDGEWPAIIDKGLFMEVRERRTYRATALARPTKDGQPPQRRFYVLRGLVTCSDCGIRMNGTVSRYVCGRIHRLDDTKCSRGIQGKYLTEFVIEAALRVLENLELRDDTPTTVMSDTDRAAVQEAHGELAVLKEMWKARELPTVEYREMRAVVEARLTRLQARTVIRPTAQILNGITGENARPAWQAMTDNDEGERQNAILRFLFAAVIIGPSATPGRFDYSRIEIEPNPL